MFFLNIDDIKIMKSYEKHSPSKEKMDHYRYLYALCHTQVKPVTLTRNNVLVDGYIQYLIAKENGMSEIECEYRKETYIYGTHDGNPKKEYIWKIPSGKKWYTYKQSLKIGDRIFVHSQQAVVPVTVTRIQELSQSPVNTRVKRVANQRVIKKLVSGRCK